MDPERVKEAIIFRRYAFIGVSLATFASILTVVVVPMLYMYLQMIQTNLRVGFLNVNPEKKFEWVLREKFLPCFVLRAKRNDTKNTFFIVFKTFWRYEPERQK